jgi:signal transduction histidine kinase
VVAFSPVLPVNWALVIEEPWEALDDPLLRTTRAGLLLLTPVLLITLLALGFGVNQIVRPLQLLRDRATALAWGNFEAIEEPVGGIDEIGRLQQELVHMANKVRMAQQGLRSYLGAVTAGQEEERRRLARELHDDTIQALIALNQRLQLAQLAADQPATGLLEEMQAMTTQLIADLRRFTHALRPTYLEDLGLTPALEMLVKDTSEAIGTPITFELVGPAGRLAPEVELAFYRMTQEALSNVARHAAASRAAVQLVFAPEQVSLEISDDGRGFVVPESPAEMVPAGHFGLLGLQERAELIGARLDIASQPGRGTRLTVTLPRTG